MISAGIDIGARDTKAVVLRDGRISGRGAARTGFDPAGAAEEALRRAVEDAGIERGRIQRTFATGSGRDAANIADGTVEEVKALARGGRFFFPGARTVADVGAEEGRAVKLDGRGEVVDFAVNEKCAAGAGTFIESMARALDVTVEEMGPLCLQAEREIPMNAECVVFAESEAVGLIHAKTPKEDISKAVHDAVAARIASIIRRIGVNEEVVLLGGLGRSPSFVGTLARQLKLERIQVPDEPEYGAAVGAAACAAEAP